MYNMEKNVADHEINYINPHKWIEKYADYLYSYAVHRVDDEEQAKDLVQETFLAALEKIEKFEGRSSEKTWLTSILKNKIFDIFRARASSLKNLALCEAYPQFFNQEDGHWMVDLRPKEFSVQDKDAIESKEFNHILQKCLKKLPALWIAAFKMKFMDEENAKDICNELEVTPTNYWVIIHRAKVNLRACLQKHWL
jgi:RNA polymerase sigma-70 factor (TIGR02943 family)